MLQHDTSIHLWSPHADRKWYLITTIDDYSRKLLYADLWVKETSWAHIVAAQKVIQSFGCPLKYYVDNHSIFRFVPRRDSVWQKSHAHEDDAVVQWKEVLKDLGIDVIYALSPAAKGKIERPYRWLQDHMVRICAREGITNIHEAREILSQEVFLYNHKRVHSTTGEIPAVRFEKALKAKQSLFRPFEIPNPYQSPRDIFCYRAKRRVNAYRKVSFHKLEFNITEAPIRSEVDLRISFNLNTGIATIRFWYQDQMIGQYQAKTADLKKVQF